MLRPQPWTGHVKTFLLMRKIYRQQGIADAEKVKRQRADLRADRCRSPD